MLTSISPAGYGPIPARLTRIAQVASRAREQIDATHLKAHRTAAGLLKKGLFPDVSGAPIAIAAIAILWLPQ
jgi:hypothetical protein